MKDYNEIKDRYNWTNCDEIST